jgi:hypothetical protein
MKVTRGSIVECYGPWSNGHMAQAGIVTHVYGEGDESGVPVNLHLFVDLGETLIVSEVPFYASRQHALAALAVKAPMTDGGTIACYFPERADD